jgi:hypothetical protein
MTSIAAVIPAGPGDDPRDTVASVIAHTRAPHQIVVVDDTGRRDALARALRDVDVIPSPPRAPGAHGGLWVKLAAGYRHALTHFRFDFLLRLDADALVLAPGLEDVAAARVEADRSIGMLGSYRFGPDDTPRDFAPARRHLRSELGLRGLRKPALRRRLRELHAHARSNGYVDGEHCLGGAYLHTRSAVEALAARGWLDLPVLAASGLGEDHLFALLTVAAGFRIADFGRSGDPLALRWQSLPASPDDLLASGKLVAHSVRAWNGLDEAAIRAALRP